MDANAARDLFEDRSDAGRRLAGALQDYRGGDAIVLGLARGGVEVAATVAEALDLPLRALIVRKIGAPRNPELAIGAVSETGVQWIDKSLLDPTGASPKYVRVAVDEQVAEARRQVQTYAEPPLTDATAGRPAIVVDDGIATGASALVSLRSVRDSGASSILLATPVASLQAVALLDSYADRVVVLRTPDPFGAVGLYYRHFDQVRDERVMQLLRAAAERAPAARRDPPRVEEHDVAIAADEVTLLARFAIPASVWGTVLFANGSGNGRLSPRNNAVARLLNEAGMATLLSDLLTPSEAGDRRKAFDIGLLAQRLMTCIAYVRERSSIRALPYGLFGAGTGAAAALTVAAEPNSGVRAVVSRGGRPDLATLPLERVRVPTLLIVGGADRPVVALNQHAHDRLSGEKRLAVIPDATHLFEESGALDESARLARDWFVRYLPGESIVLKQPR